MDKLRENVILAGLLHDIGKFWQRAEPEAAMRKSQFLKQDTKNIIGDFCPKNNQRYSHIHSAWTYQFLASYEDYCYKNLLTDEQSLISIASKHHNPRTVIQEIIQKSDWISAGMDRTNSKDVKLETSPESNRSYNFRKQRLKPVFESIYIDDYSAKAKSDNGQLRYSLKPLNLEKETIFPFHIGNEDQSLDHEFREQLWEPFIDDLKQVPRNDFHSFLESMLALLWKYTWCIPSSTVDIPDISLYDHLRSTAAVSLCMYDYLKSSAPDELQKNRVDSSVVRRLFDNKEQKFARIICGDISGIQSFIYEIASEKAAVSLKGRSFMIQLISDACARYVLLQLNLPYTNLIYSSGGNFYILAPNVPDIDIKLNDIKKTLNRGLLEKYHGRLFLAIGSADLSARDFLEALNIKWDEAIQNAKRDKTRRFIHEMQNPEFFKPFGPVKNVKPCSICGMDMETTEESPVCKDCNDLIALGKQLKNADYLIEYRSAGGRFVPVPNIPVSYSITDKSNLTHRLSSNEKFVKIWYLNTTDAATDMSGKLKEYAFGFRFTGGNYMLFDTQGEAVTFNDLAGASDASLKRLGVLRMDVDNLGRLFKYGFLSPRIDNQKRETKELYSLSRLSTLSSMLDIYFSGYLNVIVRQAKYEDRLLIIYSGGDDIFLVGKWDHVVTCAMEIRDNFQEFCCNHPDITLSGGMAIVTPKYPIHRAAELAGEAEERSKSFKLQLTDSELFEKNAFTFLDKTFDWHDFQIIDMIKNDLVRVMDEGLNHGILNRLRRIHENYLAEKKIIDADVSISPEKRAELIEYNKWRWRTVYDLERFAKQNKKHADFIESIQRAILDGHKYKEELSHQNIQDFIDVPTRWAEFLVR